MKLLVENFKKYPVRFILTALALVFGLASLILYASTGIIPTIDEFKENLPKIVWTYTEEI